MIKKSIVAKGRVYDGREDVVVYGILSHVIDPTRQASKNVIAFMVERRWREFKALHAALKKACPWAVLPPLPDTDLLDNVTAASMALLDNPDPTMGGQTAVANFADILAHTQGHKT